MGENQLTPRQKLPLTIMASIIRGAFRSQDTLAYFDTTIAAFQMVDRSEDATAVTYMRELYAMGEIEILMTLRAQWLGKR